MRLTVSVFLLVGVALSITLGSDLKVVEWDSENLVHQLMNSELHVAEKKINSQVLLPFSDVGWFSSTIYDGAICDAPRTVVSTGILTNTCLYSHEHQNSFRISCSADSSKIF
jgi:hypothetical protein